MSNKNRNRGNNFELQCIKKLKHIFPDAVSSRSESKNLDNQQVDMVYTGNFFFQCKNMTTKPDYHIILNEMPSKKIPVIIHKKTKKAEKNFISQGEYCILKFDDFIKILEQLNDKGT